MKLEEALKFIISHNGVEALTDSSLISLLSSLDAHEDDMPSAKRILLTLISGGQIRSMIDAPSLKEQSQKLFEDFKGRTIFNVSEVEKVWKCLVSAIEYHKQKQEEGKPQALKESHSKVVSNDYSMEDLYELSLLFVEDLYEFIDLLAKDSGINEHVHNLRGISIEMGDAFTGDADTRTYRGKLFFMVLVDLFRSLDKMEMNPTKLSAPCFPLAQLLAKMNLGKDIPFGMSNTIASFYEFFMGIIAKYNTVIPIPDGFYLIGHLISDYKNIEWYNKYIRLMSDFVDYVRNSIAGDSITNRFKQISLNVFVLELGTKGIKL